MDDRGDLKFMADSVQWHVNRSPRVVYEENIGNCGSGSGLINYILRGDYDEQGYVQEAGSIGGHIYNWFKEDDVYYFFDMTHVVGDGSYSNSYYRVFATKEPRTFSEHYIGQNHGLNSRSDRHWLVLQYMYQREGSHLPMGFVSFLGIVPEDMKDDITVLYVSEDRYAPVFMEAPPVEQWPADAQYPPIFCRK